MEKVINQPVTLESEDQEPIIYGPSPFQSGPQQEEVPPIFDPMKKEEVEKVTGQAEVRNVFKVSKVGEIAGCMVTDGFIKRDSKCRVLRDGTIVYEGKIESLKRFKDDAKEVKQGFECGIKIENFNDVHEGDVIEGFEMVEKENA